MHNALRSPVSGFHRNHDAITCTERCETDEAQSRWAVKDDQIIGRFEVVDGVDKRQMKIRSLPFHLVGEIKRRESSACWNNIDPLVGRATNEGRRINVCGGVHELFDTRPHLIGIEKRRAQVSLCIGIDDQNAFADFRADGRRKPRRMRLSYTTLEVNDRDGL